MYSSSSATAMGSRFLGVAFLLGARGSRSSKSDIEALLPLARLSAILDQHPGRPREPMTLPKTMTAVEISTPGAPEVLKPATRPLPAPGPGEVLIRVRAAGVNRPDVL